MSIKWKVIASVMLLIVIISTVFIAVFIQFSNKNIEAYIDNRIANIKIIAQSIEEQQRVVYRNRIKSFISYKNIQSREETLNAFARRDRQELQRLSQPFFKILQEENSHFSSLAWITPESRNFLRVHFPYKFDDDISTMRPDIVNANATLTPSYGYIVAGQGLIYTIVQPVLYEGNHIGLVQFAIKGDSLLDAVFAGMHTPVGFLFDNEKFRFATNTILPAISDNSITIQSGHLPLFKRIRNQVDWSLDRQRICLADKIYVIVKVLNLLSYDDKLQGTLISVLDITERTAEAANRVTWIVVLSGLLLLCSFLILYFSLGRLVQKISDLNQALNESIYHLQQQADELQQEQDLFMAGPVMTFTWENSEQLSVQQVSANVRDILGYKEEELLSGQVCYADLIHPDDRQSVASALAECKIRKMSFAHDPYRLMTRDHGLVWVLQTSIPVRNSDNVITHYRGYLVDITRTMLMEKTIQVTRDRLEFIIDGAGLGTWDWNLQTGEETFNEHYAATLGYSLAELSREFADWESRIHPDDYDRVMQTLADHLEGRSESCLSEYRLRHKSGRWIWVLGIGRIIERAENEAPQRLAGIIFDITDRKEQEELRLQTARQQEQLKQFDSLRNMAGAIAHRFNNSIMGVHGNLELLLLLLSRGTEERTRAEQALQAAKSAGQVGSMMLTYVGQRPLTLHREDLVEVVKTVITENSPLFPSAVSLQYGAGNGSLYCSMDSEQMKEVIGGIIANSVESFSEGTGEIEVDFGEGFFKADSFPIPFHDMDVKDGDYVFCRIKDSGHGISPENILRIFEPFFTTRFIGRGIGLALAVGILKAHHGALTVESHPDQGTVVTILLPSKSAPRHEIAPRQSRKPEQESDAKILQGNILFADDDTMLLEMGRKILESFGLAVHTARNGQEAVDIISRQDVHFRAVLLDVSMPDMNGIKAMEEIRAIDPDLPVVLTSGYAKDDPLFRELTMQPDGFLGKPFKLFEIRSIVAALPESISRPHRSD